MPLSRLRYFGHAGNDVAPRATAIKTTTYDAHHGDMVPVSTVGGPVTINLPASDRISQVAVRLVAGTDHVTLNGYGSETIDGALTATIEMTGDGRILASDGEGHWTTLSSAPEASLLQTWIADEVAIQVAALVGTFQPLPMDVNTQASVSGTYTIPDFDVAQSHDLTLTGNVTFVFPANPVGKQFRLVLRQDAVGGRTITWPANVRMPQGAFNLSTAANATDSVLCFAVRTTHWGAVLEGKAYFP